MHVIIAGCVDPGFIFMFVAMLAGSIIGGLCGLFLNHPQRIVASWISAGCAIGVALCMEQDGVFRHDFEIMSRIGLMTFGPLVLSVVALVRGYMFGK